MNDNTVVLGKQVTAPRERSSEILHAIPRAEQRTKQGITFDFSGVDIWNIWDAYWIDCNNQAHCGVLQLEIDASSQHIIESKSLKLYLEGITWTRFVDEQAYIKAIIEDIGGRLNERISAKFMPPLAVLRAPTPGLNIDACVLGDENVSATYDKKILTLANTDSIEASSSSKVCIYNTDTFRSLCPVTGQPDYATVVIASVGALIDPTSLLGYLQSFRNHSAFHEGCCESILNDLRCRFSLSRLSVVMAFSRRGGIDITPMRWLAGQPKPEVGHLWRQ